MTSIKIFVSHRKDTISKIIKNPLYINVVCGQALADSQKGKLGDNTGNNISEKAPNYSEFTVQYWAWKNQKADYYGLCHYRRYLSFADKFYPEWNEQRFEKLKSKLDILFNNYIEKNKSTSKEDFLIWGIDNNYENETKYAWNHGRIFNTKDIFPLKTCKFEDINCYIPADFEKYTFAEYGIPYWEMPNNLGESIHWKQYFSKPEQIELAKQIIKDDIIYK